MKELVYKDYNDIPMWTYQSNVCRSMFYDFCQKMIWTTNDWNALLTKEHSPSVIISAIVYSDWIVSSAKKITDFIRKDVVDNFVFNRQSEYEQLYRYFIAIRAYTIAHPMGTDRHPNYGLDGSRICMDIKTEIEFTTFKCDEDNFKYIDIDGIHDMPMKDKNYDIVMYSYDESTQFDYLRYVFASMDDIWAVSQMSLDKFGMFQKFLSKQRKKDYS